MMTLNNLVAINILRWFETGKGRKVKTNIINKAIKELNRAIKKYFFSNNRYRNIF